LAEPSACIVGETATFIDEPMSLAAEQLVLLDEIIVSNLFIICV
jgi:hypothetical protein